VSRCVTIEAKFWLLEGSTGCENTEEQLCDCISMVLWSSQLVLELILTALVLNWIRCPMLSTALRQLP